MDYLNNFAAQITAPLICSNLRGTGMTNLLSAHTMTRRINSSDGMQDIKIGVLSVLPPETVIWNIEELPEGAQIDDPVTCITQKAKDLRAQGADLVIVLAHMGLGEQDGKTGIGDWGATALARLPCIDVIVAGHTHYRHPSDWPAARSLDPSVPVIMPGSSASHLGVLDLELKQQRNGQWRVEDHVARLRMQTNHSEPKIHSLAAPAHRLACTYLEESIGHTAERLHSYFALLRPSKIMALTARAKTIAVHQAIQGSDLEHLPILATATARSLRGAEGPSNFIDIPAGPVLRRHLAGMVPFTNKVCALILTSDKLAEWLEQSASAYGLQSPGAHRQPLLNPDVPMFVKQACGHTRIRPAAQRPPACGHTTFHTGNQSFPRGRRWRLRQDNLACSVRKMHHNHNRRARDRATFRYVPRMDGAFAVATETDRHNSNVRHQCGCAFLFR